jgi:Tfp pilus assembly protein PilN
LSGKYKVVVDCRHNALKGVLIASDGPSIFQDLPLMEGAGPDEEAIRGLLLDLTATVGGVEEIVLTGDAVSADMVAGLETEFANVRLWGDFDVSGVDAGLNEADFGAGFAPALGAVFQEYGLSDGEPLGVTDRVSIAARIQQVFQKNKRLAPALTIGLLLLVLGGHHVLCRTSIAGYRSDIESLRKEKQELLRPKEEEKRLKQVLSETNRQRVYIESVLAGGNDNLMNLLKAVSDTLPRDAALNRLYQKTNGDYWIEGQAFLGKSVYAFSEALSRIEGCKSANLESIRRVEQASDARQKLLPYDFVINVVFQPGDLR